VTDGRTSLPGLDGAAIRRRVLEASHRAGVGHVGCSLSVADVVAVLAREVVRGFGTRDPDRDRLVLSKGHAALALYAALRLCGAIDEATFRTYCQDGTLLGVHPDASVVGVDFSTGSLGQGLSYACGAALAARVSGSARRVVALVSDAELDEGSTWEAALFAGHQRLGALAVVVDANGSQALGRTEAVLDVEPLAAKWRAFRWSVAEVDGHDEVALAGALAARPSPVGAPRVVVARTTLGKGVSFMEGDFRWHYAPMTERQARAALAQVEAERAR
jgi:transketolase